MNPIDRIGPITLRIASRVSVIRTRMEDDDRLARNGVDVDVLNQRIAAVADELDDLAESLEATI